jgi:hypothetical protein
MHSIPGMSTKEQEIAVQPAKLSPGGIRQQVFERLLSLLHSPLWICLLLAFILRMWLIIRTHGVVDGDEALVGIQAEHILRGELPIYFLGQPYMGSLEAYFVALVFAIFGPSAWALRTEPALLSLALVWLTWRLAAVLAGSAQLPPYARRLFMTIAALLAAIPPLYDSVAELRTWGGLIETFVLMLLLLLSVLQLTRRWHAGASVRELAWRWAGIGLILGLGFWVYPLIAFAVLAAFSWIACDRIAAFVQLRRDLVEIPRRSLTALQRSTKVLLPALAAIPTSLLGFTPALIWGASHQWINVAFIVQLGKEDGTGLREKLRTIIRITRLYIDSVAPRVISGALPAENRTLTIIHTPLLILGLGCLIATITLVALSFLERNPWLLRIRRLAALPSLFAICAAFIFCTSRATIYAINPYGLDLAGRFATPLVLVLPFFFATVFTIIGMYIHEAGKVGAQDEHRHASLSRAVTTSRPGILQGALFTLLLVSLGAQVWNYGLANADTMFASPYCSATPANYESIITYMQREHIHYAWAFNFIAYPIVFKTDSNIIVADPFAIRHPSHSIDLTRIPANSNAVLHADRPSLLVLTQRNNPYPLVMRLLDSEHIIYRAARFPSGAARDVLVVTPLNRTVPVFELDLKDFDTLFGCSAG